MDAIMASDKDGHWVKIYSSPKNKEGSPFWSSSEMKPEGPQEKGRINQKINSPDLESSRGTSSIIWRERVR